MFEITCAASVILAVVFATAKTKLLVDASDTFVFAVTDTVYGVEVLTTALAPFLYIAGTSFVPLMIETGIDCNIII